VSRTHRAPSGVGEIDASLGLIERLGASTLVGSTDIGVAKIAVVADPQGRGSRSPPERSRD